MCSHRFAKVLFVLSLLVAVVTCWTGSAKATIYSWDNAGTGAWDATNTNWLLASVGTTPWDSTYGPGNIAAFNNSGTVTVSGNVYASGIAFDGGTTTINNGGTGVIYLSSATLGIQGRNGNTNYYGTINVPIVLNASAITINANTGGVYGLLKIAGGITGTSNLTISNGGSHPVEISGGKLDISGTITSNNTANWNGHYTDLFTEIGSGVTNITNTAGRLNITNAANAYGTTTINGGNVYFGSTAAMGTGLVTVNAAGAVTLQGQADPSAMFSKIEPTSVGVIALDTIGSATIDFNAAGFNAAFLGATSANPTFSGTFTPYGNTYRLGGGGGTLTYNVPVTGDYNVVIGNPSNSGAVVLAKANTYTGTTTLNSGTFNLGVAETPGISGPLGNPTTPAESVVLNGGTLKYAAVNTTDYSNRFSTAANQKFNVDTNGQTVIWATNLTSSGGSLAKSGSGTLTLTGTNTYTGVTTISGGTLSVATIGDGNVAGNLGAAPIASSNIVLSGSGVLQYTGATASTNRGFSINQDQNGYFNIASAETALTISGPVVCGGNANSHFYKTGPGTLILSGSNNMHTGGGNSEMVNAGTLVFAKRVAFYNGQAGAWKPSNITVSSGATLAFNVGGTGEFTNADITTLLTNLSTAVNNNGLKAGSSIGFDTTNALGGVFTIAGIIKDSAGTAGAGAVGLTKLGANTLVLTGMNTYTGATAINQGTLVVNGSLASPVTVNSGGALGGSGTVAGLLTVNTGGTLAPGNSPGILTVNNAVKLLAGSTFTAEVNGLTAGGGYDQLKTSGPVTLGGMLSLSFGSFTPTGSDVLLLIDNTGAGTTSGAFQYADNAKIGAYNGCDWYITYDANNIATPSLDGGNDVAIYTVPEPSTFALLGMGAIGLLGYVWRKRKIA